MSALHWGTHLAYDGGWCRIRRPWDVLKLFSTDASVSLAVLSAGGRGTQPCDGDLGDSFRTSLAQEQLFEDVGSWKPWLTVAYLPDWTPEVSELARELVLRHREEGRDVLVRYPINTTMPVHPRHFEVRLHLVYGSLMVGLPMLLHGRRDFGGLLPPGPWRIVERMRAAGSKCLTGINFLFAPGRTIGRQHENSFLCSCRRSFISTHFDPNGNLLRRHQVGSRRP